MWGSGWEWWMKEEDERERFINKVSLPASLRFSYILWSLFLSPSIYPSITHTHVCTHSFPFIPLSWQPCRVLHNSQRGGGRTRWREGWRWGSSRESDSRCTTTTRAGEIIERLNTLSPKGTNVTRRKHPVTLHDNVVLSLILLHLAFSDKSFLNAETHFDK